MSVINRMLQELESRHEQPQDRLPGLVRAVPPPMDPRRRWLPIGLVAAALLVAAGAWAWHVSAKREPAAAPAPAQTLSASPAAPWPAPLQTPPVDLATETGLSPESVRKASAPEVPARATPPAPVETAAAPARAEPPSPAPLPQAVSPPQADPALAVIKAAPGTTPEAATDEGMKRVSPGQRADQRYREALALIAAGRAQDAQPVLDDALRLDPRHLGAREALLGLLVDGKQYGQAERLLRDGLDRGLAPASLAMALARLQVEQADQGGALATLERYLPQGQASADYEAFYAALLQRAGRHADAIVHYQAALRLQPGRAVWWMGLGISLQHDKRSAEAEQAFARARALPGLTPELQAFVEQRLKQLQQAR
jgi:MSHA biogenesis protein MshN